MKASTPELRALLATGQFVAADLWTITLQGGAVIRWTSHDQSLSWGGNTFARVPIIERGTISAKLGPDVSTLQIEITAGPDDTLNGAPIIPYIKGHGLDGANVKLERAFAPDWSSAITGTTIDFAGKVTSTPSVQGMTAQVVVSSWTVLLNTNSPRNLFQAGCLRTLYDAKCGVDPNNFKQSGTVSSSGSGQRGSFGSGLSAAAGYYAQGRVVFTGGSNAGQSRTIRSSDGSGNFVLVQPLPSPCAAGDAFTVYAGCDLSKATCASKFNNQGRFKATPFVPLPTAALGAAGPTVTTSGGK